MAMNRATIRELVIKYLNEQDFCSMEYEKLRDQFPTAGANFDVCISRMQFVEIEIGVSETKGNIVILKAPYRTRRK